MLKQHVANMERNLKIQRLELVSPTHVGAHQRHNGVDFSLRLPCCQARMQYHELNRTRTEMS